MSVLTFATSGIPNEDDMLQNVRSKLVETESGEGEEDGGVTTRRLTLKEADKPVRVAFCRQLLQILENDVRRMTTISYLVIKSLKYSDERVDDKFVSSYSELMVVGWILTVVVCSA
ncbi:hypothetical protein FQA39_LY16582 [Lamprigera yunnana]|nr:hypothetical protein FQA39_LY16582 [Lamprigera yunnana]